MLRKHITEIIILVVIAIGIISFMYVKNYVSFQGVLNTIRPQPVMVEKSAEDNITKSAPANVPTKIDTNSVSRVVLINPSNISTQKPRLFDDIIKAGETFGPILIPIFSYFFRKKQSNKKEEEQLSRA